MGPFSIQSWAWVAQKKLVGGKEATKVAWGLGQALPVSGSMLGMWLF